MSVLIKIPSPLRKFTERNARVAVTGATVREALDALIETYADLQHHLFNDENALRSFVNIYVEGEDIRYRDGLQTSLRDGDELMIVPSVAGGTAHPVTFEREELLRYSRHFNLPEIGVDGQRKLKSASVLIVGVGGLGSPISLYLAAAGIGRIGLVDFDRVDLSNLQRQVLYTTEDVGRSKLETARDRLRAGNPHVTIDLHPELFTSENALRLVQGYDLIIDGTDNFPTRYLVNDVSVLSNTPNVYGSIFQFEGQLSVFGAAGGPCYRCLYPDPPPPGLVPSCAEGGVLGVLPGIVGALQAAEAIKLITGVGEPLIGRLLLFDALTMSFSEVRARRNPLCPACGAEPSITELIDYEQFCGVSGAAEQVSIPEVSPAEAYLALNNGHAVTLLDVRERWENELTRIEASVLMPQAEVPARIAELNPEQEIIVLCKGGSRSARIVDYLIRQGFRDVKNLKGGILAWSDQVDGSISKY
ncbi:MAG TPA: ubiquitin-like small modifier protein 1 [candidate division Zixibacteria bacterium]|nr:ubiquitin-like small modifier protein 1 [candidate division Zixibacteria bacterium]